MDGRKRLVLIGGGGHCRSVLDAAKCMNEFEEIIITDSSIPAGTKLMGCKVVGGDNQLEQLFQEGFRLAFIAMAGIKSTEQRRNIYRKAADIGFAFPNIVDPSAEVSHCTVLGEGIFIGKKAVVNAGAQVGDMAIINTGAIIEHGCRIGSFSHVAVGAVVCGDSDIGDSVFIGANSTVIQGVKIGMNSIIGAGSVILKDVAENSRVVGVGK